MASEVHNQPEPISERKSNRLSWANFRSKISNAVKPRLKQPNIDGLQQNKEPGKKNEEDENEARERTEASRIGNAQHKFSESRILQLPREIRDLILKHLCAVETGADNTLPKCNGSTRVAWDFENMRDNVILAPAKYPNYKFLNVIHTCTLLRAEGLEYFHRLQSSDGSLTSYKLDLAICETPWWMSFLPTWYHTLLPPPFYETMKSVDVDLRIIGGSNYIRAFTGCGGVPRGYHGLFHLLSDFINHGPQFYYDPRLVNQERPFIDVLNLHITMWKKSDEGLHYEELIGDPNRRLPTSMGMWIWHIANEGYLAQKVGKVVIHSELGAEEFSVLPFVKDKNYPSTFASYGFYWGPKPSTKYSDICNCVKYGKVQKEMATLVDVLEGGHIKREYSC